MDYAHIIKRAWHITWRYRALWVLGLFAGISGCQPGGGGNSSGGGNSNFGSGSGSDLGFDRGDISALREQAFQWLPFIIGVSVLLVAVWALWSILGVAARGGLITGVNMIQEGQTYQLGQLWGGGFSRFWTMVGIGILLQLPVIAVALLMLVLILAPIIAAVRAGGEPGVEVLFPMCGSLAIGLPLLLVMSFVLGIMYLIGTRYIMLGGQGAFEAAGNSWRFLRARFKDTFLMWLISAGLNGAASFVVAIPMAIAIVVMVVPMVPAVIAKSWSSVVGLLVVMVAIIWALSMLYVSIWGTFSSALWTMFFRLATGMEQAPAAARVLPAPAPEQAPVMPVEYAPPVAPEPPAPPAPPADV